MTQNTLPPGFTHRAGRLDDAQIVTDLLNADSMATVGKQKFSLDECISEWSTPDFDLATASQGVFAPNGDLAGYVEVWDVSETPVSPALFGATHPDYTGLGIASWLLEWGEHRMQKTIERCPPDAMVEGEIYVHDRYQPKLDLAAGCGYRYTRSFIRMIIDVDQEAPFPEPNWPDRIRVLSMPEYGDPFAMAKAAESAFEDHFGFIAESDEEIRKDLDHTLSQPIERFDPALWFVALEGDEIAGIVFCSPMGDENPALGWVATLGVLRPFRKRGLGLALLHHAFQALAARPQVKQIGLTVDADSLTGATRLYEKAGMRVEYDIGVYRKMVRDGVRLGRS